MWKDEAEQREGRQFHQEVKMLGQQQGITLIRARSGRSYFLIFLCRGEDGFRKELEKLVGEQNPLRVGSEDLAGGESWRWHIMKSPVRGLAGSSGPANTGCGERAGLICMCRSSRRVLYWLGPRASIRD